MTERPTILRIATDVFTFNTTLKGQLHYINTNGFQVHTASADGPEVTEMTLREGVHHHVVPFVTGFRPLRDLRCIWKLIRLIKKLQPAIVHTHTPKAGRLGMLAARICGVPHRLHTVGSIPSGNERFTYACATGIYPNSVQLKEYVTKHIGHYDKMKVLANGSSNGIDLNHFAEQDDIRSKADTLNKLWRVEQRVVFTFVGKTIKEKGIYELIDAFTTLKEAYPVSKLLLINPYDTKQAPLEQATQAKIEKDTDIINLGYQKDIRPYLLMSNVFVFPSHREGLPVELLQASAMGIPAITSNIIGCNEVIKHRINGLLIPPKNTKALTAAMAALASTKAWRTTYGTKAREHVVKHYEQAFVWGEVLKEYVRLVDS